MSEQLTRIRKMAHQLVIARREVERLEEALEAAKALESRMEREDLPELMREAGLTSFVMQDGSEVQLIEDVACKITDDNSEHAMSWLDANGFGGLIKTQMQVTFNREDRATALKMAQEVLAAAKREKVEINPIVTAKVHPATLKSFIKEELKKGTALPFDVFSIHPYSVVKIKPGKE